MKKTSKIEIPDNKKEMMKQLIALEYLLKIDNTEKSKIFHKQAIKDMKEVLDKMGRFS